jgi:hypothetical protein
VRDSCAGQLDALVQTYKGDWVFSRLLPKLTENLSRENSFLVRLTVLKCLGAIARNV